MKCVEFGSIITSDEKLQHVLQIARNVASSKATVLIVGESGTGKELLAKYIHEQSPRSGKRFVAINCAAVPEGLLESELFGYERGAFTGAVSQKVGKFEQASGSTILLDEISEMPITLQAKLLRVLQEEEVDRLGGKIPVKVNLRVIATTNRDLWQLVREGKFREDLYYRLNVIPLNIPPLRERKDDVVVLADHFVKVSAILNGRGTKHLSPQALDKIRRCNWPGNVRELENVIERAVLMSAEAEIGLDHVVIESHEFAATNEINAELKSAALNESEGISLSLEGSMTIAEMERHLIMKTLERTRQNRTQAARLLGISIRTLRNKLHEYRSEESHG